MLLLEPGYYNPHAHSVEATVEIPAEVEVGGRIVDVIIDVWVEGQPGDCEPTGIEGVHLATKWLSKDRPAPDDVDAAAHEQWSGDNLARLVEEWVRSERDGWEP